MPRPGSRDGQVHRGFHSEDGLRDRRGPDPGLGPRSRGAGRRGDAARRRSRFRLGRRHPAVRRPRAELRAQAQLSGSSDARRQLRERPLAGAGRRPCRVEIAATAEEPMSVRTLFIGMDGATFTVLDDLVRPGEGGPVMPFLARIFAEGTRAKLRSTPNPLTPPAWVSLMTGRTPGHHGVFDFNRAEEQGEDVYFTLYDSRDCRVETIWSIAGRQQRRVAALNFPFTAPPPKDLNGFMVPGFVPWRHLRRNSAPHALYDRLEAIPDFNPKELAWDFEQEKQAMEELSSEDRENWVRYHLPREQQWFRIADHLAREEAPDLMAVMFDGVDKLQHQAWLYIDPNQQKGELSDYHRRMRDLCLQYFRQLDGFIERLVAAAGPQAQVFLASDHGFTGTTEVV